MTDTLPKNLILELARSLHASGSPAYELDHRMESVAAALGQPATFFSTPTALFVAFDDESQGTRLLRVYPGDTNLAMYAELFGLQQVYLNLRHKSEPAPWFTDRFLYRIVRHPLQLGILIGIWVVPTMSMSLLVLSAAMTLYIFIGLYFEEKDLVVSFGKEYLDYKQRVPKVLPFPRPASQSATGEADLVPAPSASGD